MKENLAVFPFLGDCESSSVGTDGIVIMRDIGRIRRKWIRDIKINRNSIAVHLPVGRHGDLIPGANVITGFVKIEWPICWLADPVELPISI